MRKGLNDVEEKGKEMNCASERENRKLTPLAELREPADPVGEVRFKTIVPSIFLITFGALMVFLQGVTAKIGGAVFAACGLFGLVGVQNHVTARLYKDSITLIDHEAGAGINIPYADIEEWNINNGIVLKTKDGEKLSVESFACGKALKILRQYLPERETKQILNRRRKQEKFKNPLALFKKSNRKR